MKKDSKEKIVIQNLYNLEQHIQEKDVSRVLDDIKVLSEHFIYSTYKIAYEKNEKLKPKAIRFLYKNLPLSEFVAITEHKYIAKYEIPDALEGLVDKIEAEELLDLIEKLGWCFPSTYWAPELSQKLIDSDNETITQRLQQRIESLAGSEKDAGTSFSDHQKAMSTFRFIQWGPDDNSLTETVYFLAKRKDPMACKLKEFFLLNVPWGEDRSATSSLLKSFKEEGSEENLCIVRKALEKHEKLSMFRLGLLDILSQYNAEEAILIALNDLQKNTDDETRNSYISWMRTEVDKARIRKTTFNAAKIEEALSLIKTSQWSFLTRGIWNAFTNKCLGMPLSKSPKSIMDQFSVRLVRSFNICRLDHMGCGFFIPLLTGLGAGLLWLLSFLIGSPKKELAFLNPVTIAIWIVIWSVTATTHFSGHETPKQQFWMAIAFWGSLLLFLSTAIVIRIL